MFCVCAPVAYVGISVVFHTNVAILTGSNYVTWLHGDVYAQDLGCLPKRTSKFATENVFLLSPAHGTSPAIFC